MGGTVDFRMLARRIIMKGSRFQTDSSLVITFLVAHCLTSSSLLRSLAGMDRRLRFGPPFSPLMGFGNRFFDDFDFDRGMARPYWNDHSMLTAHKIGQAVDVSFI